MASNPHSTSQRKNDHIELCLNKDVEFKYKSSGFEKYDFLHNAITEVEYDKIDLSTKFFGIKISYPFYISCMTGGTIKAESINAKLALTANKLGIPIGVGSQRQALENDEFLNSYKIIRKNAPDVPVMSNIGASQIATLENIDDIKKIIDVIKADVLTIHLNPLQELIQKNGEPNFKGLIKNIKKISKSINIPVIAKEVGAGISKTSARILLDAGVRGIDIAGAGGTSWSGVEYLRKEKTENIKFWDWGIPTSYCIKEVNKLKKNHFFTLIASGGIKSGFDIAKSIILGADLAASAKPILIEVEKEGDVGVENLLLNWMEELRKIMYLTGCPDIDSLKKSKLLKKGNVLID